METVKQRDRSILEEYREFQDKHPFVSNQSVYSSNWKHLEPRNSHRNSFKRPGKEMLEYVRCWLKELKLIRNSPRNS